MYLFSFTNKIAFITEEPMHIIDMTTRSCKVVLKLNINGKSKWIFSQIGKSLAGPGGLTPFVCTENRHAVKYVDEVA